MTKTRSSLPLTHARGFTLVELMVAVSGGLFVAISVFMLARDGTRFYQHESRIADATISAMVGFGRLQADIARAGFMSSPNVRNDPSHCERLANPTNWAQNWPALLAGLASVRIRNDTPLPANLPAWPNGQPDAIVLAGSFGTAEEFPAAGIVQPGGGAQQVVLQTTVGPLPRLGYLTIDPSARQAFLDSIFPRGRGLRIVDPSGMTHYAAIQGVAPDGTGAPVITLAPAPAPMLRGINGTLCSLTGTEGARVSVINFVRYQLQQVAGNAAYAPLFAAADGGSELGLWEQGRTDLVREELDVQGVPIPETFEIVAEYAVDLKFGLTAVTASMGAAQEPSVLTTFAPDPANQANIQLYAGDPGQGATPQRIRAVRVRLSVRSQVPDREGPITATDNPGVPDGGFFRMRLGDKQYARVRTLQADVALHNHAGITWGP